MTERDRRRRKILDALRRFIACGAASMLLATASSCLIEATINLAALEVVQSMQNPANDVKLVAGKRTWARVYFSAPGSSISVTAKLWVVWGTSTQDLIPSSPPHLLPQSPV